MYQMLKIRTENKFNYVDPQVKCDLSCSQILSSCSGQSNNCEGPKGHFSNLNPINKGIQRSQYAS